MTDIEKLYKRVYELEVFKKGSFTLSSGKKSNYYIFFKSNVSKIFSVSNNRLKFGVYKFCQSTFFK